jgi:signal transduction histidine kinase
MPGQFSRILLVEDNAVEAELLAEILADTGEPFDVTRAASMADAQHRLAQTEFDAVLLDLSLPDSRGLETVERIQAVAPRAPIVVLTGLDDEALGAEAIRKGAQDYLIKGHAEPRLLVRAIRYAVQRKHAEEQIRTLNAELEQRVIERTAVARRRASQLRVLAAQLTMVEQRERRRLAQVLHDHLQQLLVATRLKTGMLSRRLQDENARPLVEQVDQLLVECIQASRSLTMELSPPVLYDAGLIPALEWLARQMREKHALDVEFESDPRAGEVAEETAVLLFSAIRELLFNVVKHAGVHRARVCVGVTDCDQVRIVVCDQGSGFDPAGLHGDGVGSGGFGLFSIRERLELLGGKLVVEATPGKGSRVEILAPRGPRSDARAARQQ